MSAFLDEMATASRRRLAGIARDDLAVAGPPRALVGFGEGFDLIAEIKPRSPSEGRLGSDDPGARAAAYERGGAAVISVLTEPSRFEGSLDLLAEVRAAVAVPVLCKDFLVDPAQIAEARSAGADGVLLIVRMLDDAMLGAMLETAADLGMFALVEAFDRADLQRASRRLDSPAVRLAGVNARDLDTLEVDPGAHARLAPDLPAEAPVVAESAIRGPGDIEAVARLGYRGALVGSALMRSDDPEAMVAAMVEAGRRAVEPVTR